MPHKTKENIYFMPISLGGSDGKESACDSGDPVLIPGLGRSLADLAWRIPWAEELAGLQSMESQRVGHN